MLVSALEGAMLVARAYGESRVRVGGAVAAGQLEPAHRPASRRCGHRGGGERPRPYAPPARGTAAQLRRGQAPHEPGRQLPCP